MKRIFILEDDPARMELFHEALKDDHIDRADNVPDAIARFTPPYDVICLDHDLGGEVYVPSERENTGYQFAKHLATREPSGAQVVVHSWNMPGALRMVNRLRDAGWDVTGSPFGPTLLNALKSMDRGV